MQGAYTVTRRCSTCKYLNRRSAFKKLSYVLNSIVVILIMCYTGEPVYLESIRIPYIPFILARLPVSHVLVLALPDLMHICMK